MSPEPQEPNSGNATAELAFVQQALAAADRSERSSRIVVAVLAILPFVTFIWMHLHLFPPENLGQILHSLLRVDLFFLVPLFAITVPAHGWLHHKSPRNLLKFEAWRGIHWGFAFQLSQNPFESCLGLVFIGITGRRRCGSGARSQVSGTLLR